MANQKFTDLPASAWLALSDLIAVVDDVAGTPQSQKATVEQLAAFIVNGSDGSRQNYQISAVLPALGGSLGYVLVYDILQALRVAAERTVINATDRLLITSEEEVGDPPRYIVPATLLKAVDALTATTDPALDDKWLIYDTSAAAARAVTGGSMFSLIGALPQFTAAINGAADRLFYYEDGVGMQWISPDHLGAGKYTAFIPAGAFIAQTTNGATAETTELPTSDVMLRSFLFDASTKEYIQGDIWMPPSWDLGDPEIVDVWTAATGTAAQGVVWATAARAFGNDDALDAAFGTELELADAYIAANDLHETAAGTLDIAGTPSASRRWVKLRKARQVAHGSDTKTGDAKWLGMHLIYSTDKRDDS